MDKRTILHSDLEGELFLRLSERTAEPFEWVVLAYRLMPNHYHLAVVTRRPTIAAGMQWLNSVFVSTYNTLHDREGVLVERRYWHNLIEDRAVLPAIISYVVMNPVRAGLPDARGLPLVKLPGDRRALSARWHHRDREGVAFRGWGASATGGIRDTRPSGASALHHGSATTP